MSTICVLIVSIVGVLHLFSWGANEADDSKLPGESKRFLSFPLPPAVIDISIPSNS